MTAPIDKLSRVHAELVLESELYPFFSPALCDLRRGVLSAAIEAANAALEAFRTRGEVPSDAAILTLAARLRSATSALAWLRVEPKPKAMVH